MKQTAFERQNRRFWTEMSACLGASGGSQLITDFPAAYRQLCQHLALAKSRHYSPSLIEELSDLVLKGHNRLHGRGRGQWGAMLDYFVKGFPRAVRREWKFLAVATVLFWGPLLGLGVWIQFQPDVAGMILDGGTMAEMRSMYDPENRAAGRTIEADTNVMAFGFYLRNNTSIGLQMLGGGMLACVGTIFFLLFNGIYIGAIAGYLIGEGLGHATFFPFVSGHSATELTAICIAGAAGLLLGWALIRPGIHRRSVAIRLASKRAIQLIWGMMTLFILAAMIEAFWSSSDVIPRNVKYIFGISQWLLLIVYLLFAGRRRAA